MRDPTGNAGTLVGDLCRQLGVGDATFYACEKKYVDLGVSELRWFWQLEEEGSWLKRLVGDLSLDRHMMSETLQKKSKARTLSRIGRLASRDISGQLPAGLSVDPIQSRRVVSTQSGEGLICVTLAHSGSCPCAASIWVSADLGAPAPRRLARKSQAGAALYRLDGLQLRMRG